MQLRDIISVCGCELTRITLPYELNYKEMNMVNYGVPTEFVAEGFVPVMISKQCVRKLTDCVIIITELFILIINEAEHIWLKAYVLSAIVLCIVQKN